MAATIRDVYLQFNPLKPLEANDLRYVDCTRERGLPALFQGFRLPLEDEPRPLLFSGHLGDGKTTILKQLQGQLTREEQDFVVFGDVIERLGLIDIVEYDDVLLTILAVVDEALRAHFQAHMEAPRFQRIWQALSGLVNFEPHVDLPVPLIGQLTVTLRDFPDVRRQVRQRLREARGTTFLGVVNDYLHQAQEIVRQQGYRNLVVIVDSLETLLDTLSTGQVMPDERLFLGQATQLLGVQCHVIYTVPLAFVHAQSANLAMRYGSQPLVVPLLPVRWPDGTPHETGMGKLREIIQRRLEAIGTDMARAFSDMTQVDRLCRASSGHLRMLMFLMQTVCSEARAVHPDLPLTSADVSAAIQRVGAQRRRLASSYTDALQQVAQTHRLDGLPGDVRQALLHHYLVYEYFSGADYWYDTSMLLHAEEAGDGT